MAKDLITRSCDFSCAERASKLATQLQGGITYLLRDDFKTTESAPIASPRTCEPGPGTLTVTQTGTTKFGITGGALDLPDNTGWTDSGFYGGAVTRASGRLLYWSRTVETGEQQLAGWRTSQAVDATVANWESGAYSAALTLQPIGSGNQAIATLSNGTTYEFMEVLRAAGDFTLIKGGAFTEWTLLWVTEDHSTATVYPGLASNDGVGPLQHIRIPDLTYTPTPLVSDSFNRGDSSDLGSTDSAGSEETAASSVAWVEAGAVGSEIFSSAIYNDTDNSSPNFALAYCESGEADVLAQGTCIHTGLGATIPGLLLRYVDDNNFWLVDKYRTTQPFRIKEVTGGTVTTRASSTFDDDNGEILVVAEDETITAYYNGGNRISYGSAAQHKTSTKHGVSLLSSAQARGAGIDNFVIWPRTLPAADQTTLDAI